MISPQGRLCTGLSVVSQTSAPVRPFSSRSGRPRHERLLRKHPVSANSPSLRMVKVVQAAARLRRRLRLALGKGQRRRNGPVWTARRKALERMTVAGRAQTFGDYSHYEIPPNGYNGARTRRRSGCPSSAGRRRSRLHSLARRSSEKPDERQTFAARFGPRLDLPPIRVGKRTDVIWRRGSPPKYAIMMLKILLYYSSLIGAP
jgi:hypothetical protein